MTDLAALRFTSAQLFLWLFTVPKIFSAILLAPTLPNERLVFNLSDIIYCILWSFPFYFGSNLFTFLFSLFLQSPYRTIFLTSLRLPTSFSPRSLHCLHCITSNRAHFSQPLKLLIKVPSPLVKVVYTVIRGHLYMKNLDFMRFVKIFLS